TGNWTPPGTPVPTGYGVLAQDTAAELLGIPYDKVTQGGLFPIAYTIGTDFKPAIREPLSKVLHWDKW
ncbi:MAG: hypothetical protein ACH36C_09035, partial [Ilumatobacteraceae bacterium]